MARENRALDIWNVKEGSFLGGGGAERMGGFNVGPGFIRVLLGIAEWELGCG